MCRILYLTRCVYAEQEIESRIRKLGHEVFCSLSLLTEIKNKEVPQNFLSGFEVVLLSETVTKKDSDDILPEISQQVPLIIQLSETEQEASQNSLIQIYLSPETSLETMREVLSVEKRDRPRKVSKLVNPSLRQWNSELIFKEITFTRVEQLILKELLQAEGEPLSQGELAQLVWGKELNHSIQSQLSATIGRLRRRIKEHGFDNTCVQTVWGKGYAVKRD